MIVKVLYAHCWSLHPFSFKLNFKKLLVGAKYNFRCWSFLLTAGDALTTLKTTEFESSRLKGVQPTCIDKQLRLNKRSLHRDQRSTLIHL